MKFFEQMYADAQPKADVITRVVSNLTVKSVNTIPVRVVRNVTYKTSVTGLAVGIAATRPLAPVSRKFWAFMEELAAEPVSVVKAVPALNK